MALRRSKYILHYTCSLPYIFSVLFFENQIHILLFAPVDEQMAALGVELEKRNKELKRRRQEAKEHAEQMKVQYYVIKFGPMAFVPALVAQVKRKDAGKTVIRLDFCVCSLL